MRVPIYDPEDAELMTVIDLDPSWIRMMEMSRFYVLRFAIPPEVPLSSYVSDMSMVSFKAAEIEFMPLFLQTKKGRLQTWTGLALNPETVLLMKSTFLPGQYKEVHNERQDAFYRGMAAAFRGLMG